MKLKKRLSNNVEIEVEGDGQKDLFKQLASVEEIFGEEKCGMCGKPNIRFMVRSVEGNDYFELKCLSCHASLSYGQHKKGGTLFPKRKDDNNNWLDNNGWYKWQPKDKQ